MEAVYGDPRGCFQTEFHRTACKKLKCDQLRRQVLGFVSNANDDGFGAGGILAAGATGTVARDTQKPLMPERLMIVGTIAAFIDVLDIRVGNQPQSVSNVALPGEAFEEDAVDAWVMFDCAETSQSISIQVTNIDGAGHPFRAQMYVWTPMI